MARPKLQDHSPVPSYERYTATVHEVLDMIRAEFKTEFPYSTFMFWRYKGIGPSSFKVNARVVRYDLDECREYFAAHFAKGHRQRRAA